MLEESTYAFVNLHKCTIITSAIEPTFHFVREHLPHFMRVLNTSFLFISHNASTPTMYDGGCGYSQRTFHMSALAQWASTYICVDMYVICDA